MSRSLRFFAVTFLMIAPGAFAQNNRSAVSVNGNDANTCTTLQPCRSFTAAMARTNAGGEIIALDSAGYGPFTIDKTMSVSGAPGVHAAITATGSTGAGIFVQAGTTDVITLRNLVLIGAGATEGIQIPVQESGPVHIIDCLISGFGSGGIDSGAPQIDVDHCTVIDNTNSVAVGLIFVSGKARVTNSLIANNTVGLEASDYSSVVVTNSSISGNGTGAEVRLFSIAPADLALDRCTISGNGTGVFADFMAGGSSTIRLSNNLISYNATGVQATTGGVIYTYGNNSLSGNTVDVPMGTTLSALAQQ